MKNRKTKGSNLPSININKQSLLLLNRLEGDEIKNILNAIQQYVYRGEEIDIDEELKDILESILDNIEHIGLKYINKANANRENGKKGGRPKKEQNKTINPQDSNNIPQEIDNTSESLKMAINEEFEEPQTIEDMGNYTGIQFKQQEEIETQDYKDETIIANEFITNNGKDAYDIYYELNVLKYNEQKDTERYEELKMLWDELWTPYRVYDEETFELIKSKVAERYNKRVIKQFILENEYKQILTV